MDETTNETTNSEKKQEQAVYKWSNWNFLPIFSIFLIPFLVGIFGYVGAMGILVDKNYYSFFLSLEYIDPETFKAYKISTGVIYGAITFLIIWYILVISIFFKSLFQFLKLSFEYVKSFFNKQLDKNYVLFRLNPKLAILFLFGLFLFILPVFYILKDFHYIQYKKRYICHDENFSSVPFVDKFFCEVVPDFNFINFKNRYKRIILRGETLNKFGVYTVNLVNKNSKSGKNSKKKSKK